MSKVKGVEEEKWKHAIGPLTQSERRGGTPTISVCLLPKHKTCQKYHANAFLKHKANAETLDGNTPE